MRYAVVFALLSFSSLHAEPVDLFSLKHQPADDIPLYTIVSSTAIRNENTGVTYALKRYIPRLDTSNAEGKMWLADLVAKKRQDTIAFVPMQCQEARRGLMLCEDILMPAWKGQSIGELGVVSGYSQAINPQYLASR